MLVSVNEDTEERMSGNCDIVFLGSSKLFHCKSSQTQAILPQTPFLIPPPLDIGYFIGKMQVGIIINRIDRNRHRNGDNNCHLYQTFFSEKSALKQRALWEPD